MIQKQPAVSFAEFVVWEQEQADRHELIGGEIVPFLAGSVDQETITVNVIAKLHAAVEPPQSRTREDVPARTPKVAGVVRRNIVIWRKNPTLRAPPSTASSVPARQRRRRGAPMESGRAIKPVLMCF